VSWEKPGRFCVTRRPVGRKANGERTWLYCNQNGKGISTAVESMKGSEIEQGLLGDCCAFAVHWWSAWRAVTPHARV
jgi:hypothetical protein